MSEQPSVNKPIYRPLSTGVEGFDFLAELAPDMRWSWRGYGWRSPYPDKVFRPAKVIVNDASHITGVRHVR